MEHSIRKAIQGSRQLVKSNISSTFSSVDTIDEELEKGKLLPEGTERQHGGRTMVKTGGKWVPKKGEGTQSKKDDSSSEGGKEKDDRKPLEQILNQGEEQFLKMALKGKDWKSSNMSRDKMADKVDEVVANFPKSLTNDQKKTAKILSRKLKTGSATGEDKFGKKE